MYMHSYRGKDRLPVWILGLKESEEVLVAGVNSGWGVRDQELLRKQESEIETICGSLSGEICRVCVSSVGCWSPQWQTLLGFSAIYWGLWWGPQRCRALQHLKKLSRFSVKAAGIFYRTGC